MVDVALDLDDAPKASVVGWAVIAHIAGLPHYTRMELPLIHPKVLFLGKVSDDVRTVVVQCAVGHAVSPSVHRSQVFC